MFVVRAQEFGIAAICHIGYMLYVSKMEEMESARERSRWKCVAAGHTRHAHHVTIQVPSMKSKVGKTQGRGGKGFDYAR